MTTQAHVKGERTPNHADVTGEHHISNPLVEEEPSGSNHVNGKDQYNDVNDVIDNISTPEEVSDAKDIFEDAHFDFDPTYSPIDKWTRNHPKEQIHSDPTQARDLP